MLKLGRYPLKKIQSSHLKGTEKTGNKTVQLVVEHCCKSIVARFNSPGTNQVCVKTDFWLRGSHAIDNSYVTCCKTLLSCAGKTHNREKSGTTLQHLFSTCNNTICWRTGVKVGGKPPNIAIQLVSQQFYKTSCTFLLPVLSYLKSEFTGYTNSKNCRTSGNFFFTCSCFVLSSNEKGQLDLSLRPSRWESVLTNETLRTAAF